MRHFPNFQTQTSAKPGAVYGFMHGGKIHLGFAIAPRRTMPQGFVSVTPGSPEFGDRPGILFADNFGPNSLIAFGDARVRLPFDAEGARTGKKPRILRAPLF
jgi:hypothetical protein